MFGGQELASGTRVRIRESMDVPQWSEWDDDKGRASAPTKRRLQQLFFKGSKKVTGEIVYVAKESERDKLRRIGRCKVRIRDSSGAAVVITCEHGLLTSAR
jgi:uncharacterized protein YhfF